MTENKVLEIYKFCQKIGEKEYTINYLLGEEQYDDIKISKLIRDNNGEIFYKSGIAMTPQKAKEWMKTIRDDRMSVADDDDFVLEDIWALDYVIGLLDYIKE